MDTKTEELLYGKKKKLTLPSGYTVTIREQNGADDDIISNQVYAEDLTNIDIFLATLVIETNLPFAKGKRLNKDNIKNMLLKDKYFILFASRVHSMGEDVRFTFDWGEDNGGKTEYTEDLTIFIWDYSKPMPEEGDENYQEERITPYVDNPYDKVEITLNSSGKKLRFDKLNGFSEKYLLGVKNITRNDIYKSRNLEQWVEDKWQKVANFMYFNKREMAELHKVVAAIDPEFTGTTHLVNPYPKAQVKEMDYPIMRAESFFYPEEI